MEDHCCDPLDTGDIDSEIRVKARGTAGGLDPFNGQNALAGAESDAKVGEDPKNGSSLLTRQVPVKKRKAWHVPHAGRAALLLSHADAVCQSDCSHQRPP